MYSKLASVASALAISTLFAFTAPANAAAVRDSGAFTDFTLAANDDGSTGSVAIGFTINFFGNSFSNLFVNNNGNVTFNGPLGTFTPFPILTTGVPMLAPFFADVWTFDDGDGQIKEVTYGQDSLSGRNVFGVNWIDVSFYADSSGSTLNSFQLIITDRSDTGAGNFDFEFNYDRIVWETGQASGSDASGLGGSSARAGWSNGTDTAFEIPGAGVNGAYLDGNLVTGLIHNSINSDVDGRYIFAVRNGVVQPPVTTPEPASMAVLGIGLAGLALLRRRRG